METVSVYLVFNILFLYVEIYNDTVATTVNTDIIFQIMRPADLQLILIRLKLRL